MEIMSYILESIIVLVIGLAFFWIDKQRKKQPKSIRIEETTKMINKILLNICFFSDSNAFCLAV